MPIYEYQCIKCGAHFEKLMKVGEEDSPECPECYSHDTKKKLSTSHFQVKGQGAYDNKMK